MNSRPKLQIVSTGACQDRWNSRGSMPRKPDPIIRNSLPSSSPSSVPVRMAEPPIIIFSRKTISFSCRLVMPCISRIPNSSLRDCRKEPTDTNTNREQKT
ncbi:hypothetical protein D3C87_1965940 [compost metagenome]